MTATEIKTGDPGTKVAHQRDAALPAERASGTDVEITSPASLIKYAIDRQLPAAELKELVVLHERMEDRVARRAFFEALRAFQQDCPPIKKNKKATIPTKGGGSYSFKYAELDEIERHVKPYLEKHELAYSFDSTVDDKGSLLTNVFTLRHVLGHSERTTFTLPTSSESAMTAQQRFSAANNFAKRQNIANGLGISITEKEVPDDEVDPTKIDEDQATHLEDLLAETKTNRVKFLALFDAESVQQVRAAVYPTAVRLLEAKKPAAGARA